MISHPFKVGDRFLPSELNQTDFGRIYFNLPKETHSPSSIEELALVLKKLNSNGKKVKIRNSGHSVNGQTLTDGVQISLLNMKKIEFDERKMEVTIGAGNSWDEAFRGINFPKYCLPMFPNNPGQEIHVAGTASVGGGGIYSSKYGGLWNHILKIKLVTMTGDIIECSRDSNPDYFKFALGGFGRIGVIGELTIGVIPSKAHVVWTALLYLNSAQYYSDLNQALKDQLFDGFCAQQQVCNSQWVAKLGLSLKFLSFWIEVDEMENCQEVTDKIKRRYNKSFCLTCCKGEKENSVNLSLKAKRLPKQGIIYTYSGSFHRNRLDRCHPWSDFVVDKKSYPDFVREAEKIIRKHGMQRYFLKQWFMNDNFGFDLFLTYGMKRIAKERNAYPLSLDLPHADDFYLVAGIFLSVPPAFVGTSIKMIDELTHLVYKLNGKRYLYGIHNLSPDQVEKQFGRENIEKWQRIKDELDPKHLLNIGVIEHLD